MSSWCPAWSNTGLNPFHPTSRVNTFPGAVHCSRLLELSASCSRKTQAKLEEANAAQREQLESERYHAQEAADKAKDMIKVRNKHYDTIPYKPALVC